MVGYFRGLALAATLAALPVQALAAGASDVLTAINQCGMTDPTGQTHMLSLNGDTIVLRNQDKDRLRTMAEIPAAKAQFDFQPRSPNPEYGATLSLKCADGTECVAFKRDDGFTWKALGFALILNTACGRELDLAGKSLPR